MYYLKNNRTLFVFPIFFLIISGCHLKAFGSYQPVGIPLEVSVNSDGEITFSVIGKVTMPTPLGTFSIGVVTNPVEYFKASNILTVRVNCEEEYFYDLHGNDFDLTFNSAYYQKISLQKVGTDLYLDIRSEDMSCPPLVVRATPLTNQEYATTQVSTEFDNLLNSVSIQEENEGCAIVWTCVYSPDHSLIAWTVGRADHDELRIGNGNPLYGPDDVIINTPGTLKNISAIITWTPSNVLILLTPDHILYGYDLTNGEISKITDHVSCTNTCEVSPDGRYLTTYRDEEGYELASITIYDLISLSYYDTINYGYRGNGRWSVNDIYYIFSTDSPQGECIYQLSSRSVRCKNGF